MAEYGEPLTEREKEILCLVATGVTNREVGYRLSISVNTVKVHLRNVFAKLGAESRTEATLIAFQEGWATLDNNAQTSGDENASQTKDEDTSDASIAVPAPLPWPKRVALIVAALLVAVGMAVTWPRNEPQAGSDADLPLDRPQTQPPAAPAEGEESRWQELAQMPTRRAYLGAAAVAGRVLAIAGQTPEGVTPVVEIYNPDSDIWTRGSDKPSPVAHVAAAAIGTDVIVPGGCDAEGVPVPVTEVYDAQADTWRAVTPLPKPRCAYALATLDGKLYLFGGWDGNDYVASTYVYDPEDDTWAESTPMPSKRGFLAATAHGGRIYVVGGYDNEQELTTCAVYTTETETWAACPSTMIGRGGVGLASLGGRLYAIGGGGWTSYLGFSEQHDPFTDEWHHFETPLEGEWRSPGVVVLDSTIYAIGGWSGDYRSLNLSYQPLTFRVFIPVSQQQ